MHHETTSRMTGRIISLYYRDDSAITQDDEQLRTVAQMLGDASSQKFSSGNRREHPIWPFLLFLSLSILACYGPVTLEPYAFSDDYTQFYNAAVQRNFVDRYQMIASGRPLYAFLLELTLTELTEIGDLRYIRLAGVIGIIALALLIFRTLSTRGWSRLQSTLIAIIICTLPPFQVYAAWAATAFFPYSALLSGLAFIVAEKGLSTRGGSVKTVSLVMAVALLSASFAVYQPTAMFFWFFAAVFLLDKQDSPLLTLRRFLYFLMIMASAMAVAYIMFKAGQALFPGAVGPERSTLCTDVSGKMFWFIREPLRNAFNLHNIYPSTPAAVGFFLFCVFGLMFFLKGPWIHRATLIALLFLILLLSYMPNLVVTHSWFVYRTIIVVGSLVAIYGLCALRGCLGLFSMGRRRLILNAALLVATVGCLIVSSKNVRTYFIKPQMTEMKLAREAVSLIDLSRVTTIYVIRSHWENHLAPHVFYDEFGLPSSVHPWSSKSMVALFVWEKGQDVPDNMVTVAERGLPFVRDERTAVIDFKRILENFRNNKGGASLSWRVPTP
jgi:Glucosyl transferase GtrII